MKALNVLLIFSLFSVSSANEHKKWAMHEAVKGNTVQATGHLRQVLALQKEPEQEVMLNLAHLYYLSGNIDSARFFYSGLSSGKATDMASIADNQLGVIYFSLDKRDSAEYHFEKALRLNPSNYQAAYNFELLKRTEKKRRHKPTGKPSAADDADNQNLLPPDPSTEKGMEEGALLKSVNNKLAADELEKMLQAFKNRNNKYLQQEEWKKLNLQR